MDPNRPGFNPNAFQFNPGQSTFVPGQNPYAQQQQQQPGQNPYNPYGGAPYGQPPQAAGGYYNQPYGGYGGQPPQPGGAYPSYGGQQGGAGGYQNPYQAPQSGYGGSGYQQAPPAGGSSVPSLPPPRQPNSNASAAGRPSPAAAASSSGPAKSVSLSIGGGGGAAGAATKPAAGKTMSISIGGKKVTEPAAAKKDEKAAAPAKVISIGGGSKPSAAASAAATPSTSMQASRAATPGPAAAAAPEKEEKSVAESAGAAADWDEPEASAPESTPAAPAPASETTPIKTSAAAAGSNKSIFTRAAAKTDADAIAKEAARVADADTMKELYGGEEIDPNVKQHLNVVFIGHVDAGKSTMGGQLLVSCGMVDKRTIEKLEKEAKDAGREGWWLSWALDSTPQERAQGKTVEVGRAFFETDVRRYTILDAPGHKTYVPSMISGAAQADIAILVISARKGEFETGFERGGQTREHAMLVKNNGVNKIIVIVNKMADPTVAWSKDRFDEVVSKIGPFLQQVGYKKTDVTYVPTDGFSGGHVKTPVDKKLAPWCTGPTLLTCLDEFKIEDRKVNAPLIMPISEKYNEVGTVTMGKIEAGRVRKGDSLLLMPNRVPVEVASVQDEQGEDLTVAMCGESVRIRLKGIEDDAVMPGYVLTSLQHPVKTTRRFRADVAIIDAPSGVIAPGYGCVIHIHTLSEEVRLVEMPHYYDKKTGRKSKKPAGFAKKGMRVVAIFETDQYISMERFADYPSLGRFSLRDSGATIAIGKVTKILDADGAPDVSGLNISGGAAANGGD